MKKKLMDFFPELLTEVTEIRWTDVNGKTWYSRVKTAGEEKREIERIRKKLAQQTKGGRWGTGTISKRKIDPNKPVGDRGKWTHVST